MDLWLTDRIHSPLCRVCSSLLITLTAWVWIVSGVKNLYKSIPKFRNSSLISRPGRIPRNFRCARNLRYALKTLRRRHRVVLGRYRQLSGSRATRHLVTSICAPSHLVRAPGSRDQTLTPTRNDSQLNGHVAVLANSVSSVLFNITQNLTNAYTFWPKASSLFSADYATNRNTSQLRVSGHKDPGERMPKSLSLAVMIMPDTSCISCWPVDYVIWFGGFGFAKDPTSDRYLLKHQYIVDGWNWRSTVWRDTFEFSIWNCKIVSSILGLC